MKKKIFVIVCCLAGTMCLRGQVVQEQESALVYYMPQTVVDITLTYTVDSEEAGPYSRYAEKYLGAQDVISVNSQKAEIVGVRVESHSEADLSRAVKVSARDGVRMQLLSLRENGVLYGYNVGVCPAEERSEEALEVSPRVAQPETLPFTEEQLRAPGLAQQADAVAKQIYRIREARMYLLSGEIENAPADGRGLEVALKALSRQEKELVQLFTGKRSRKTVEKRVRYVPTKSEEQALLYFSPENGVTAEEDASALPIMLHFIARKQVLAPAVQTKRSEKDAPALSPLYYNLPGTGLYSISYDGATLVEGTLQVAQFGVAVPLMKSLFTGNTLPKIYFDPQTGNIQAICHE